MVYIIKCNKKYSCYIGNTPLLSTAKSLPGSQCQTGKLQTKSAFSFVLIESAHHNSSFSVWLLIFLPAAGWFSEFYVYRLQRVDFPIFPPAVGWFSNFKYNFCACRYKVLNFINFQLHRDDFNYFFRLKFKILIPL